MRALVHCNSLQYHLDKLLAFSAAYQQLVVGAQPLPIKLPQQDHLWNDQQRGSCVNAQCE